MDGYATHPADEHPDDGPAIAAELVPTAPPQNAAHPVHVVAGRTPEEMIANAEKIASHLATVIKKQGLAKNLDRGRSDREHVEVGGWQLAGTLMGAMGGISLHAETVWTRRVANADGTPEVTEYTQLVKRYHSKSNGGGLRETVESQIKGYSWEARVEVRTVHGEIVGAAEAMCSRLENTWSTRDDFALRSMAETRAESRAYRRAIGWIIQLAGFDATPAEEMGGGDQRGGDTTASSSPSFGPVMPDNEKAFVGEALERILTIAGGPKPRPLAAGIVKSIRQRVESAGVDPYMPDVAAATIVFIAEAIEYARAKAAEPAADAPPASDPPNGSGAPTETAQGPNAAATGEPSRAPRTDPPEWALLASLPPDDQLPAMRRAGCKCPLPPMPCNTSPPRFAKDCPIVGHEADGLRSA